MLGHAPPSPIPGQRHHPPLYWLLLWVATWMCFGLVGHHPWRDDELVQLALTVDVLDGGHLHAARLGDMPWLTSPPWAVWMSALGIATFHPMLALHDAARLPGLLALLLTFWALLRWAHPRFARRDRWAVGLALFSALSLTIPAHGNAAELWTLAGFALLTGGACRPDRRWPRSAAMLATGLSLAMLSGGLVPWLSGVLMLATVSLLQPQRSRHRSHGFAVFASGLLASIWLINLEPAELASWIAQDPLLRLLSGAASPGYGLWLEIRGLLWSWPVWPLAIWAVWSRRHNLRADPRLLAPAALAAAALGVGLLAPGGSEVHTLPLLAPLALLAGPGLLRLPRGSAAALHWFGVLLFSALAGLLWIYWAGAHLGWPEFAAERTHRLLPAYDGHWAVWQPAVGATATLAAVVILHLLRRTPLRPLLAWCVGVSTGWVLVITLAGHWLETARSDAPVMASLARHLPGNGCLTGSGLRPSDIAAVRVYTGHVIRTPGHWCSLQLVRVGRGSSAVAPDTEIVWRGRRPGNRHERLLLVRRATPIRSPAAPVNAAAGSGVETLRIVKAFKGD